MEKLRFGVVGVGGMGRAHLRAVKDAPEAILVAGADISEQARKAAAEEYGIPTYPNLGEMLAHEKLDAITICVPHPFHKGIAIEAMMAGKHVLCEKPLAVSVAEADEMVAVAERQRVKLGVCFQQRTVPQNQEVARIIHSGEIGEIYRVSLIFGSLRTQQYYRTGTGWRGTWKGEGGAVLLNQAPHPLDMIQWFAGMPTRLFAFAGALLHEIEAEDSASATLEYPNGGHGCIQANTIEFPGGWRYEIFGTRGTIMNTPELRLGKPSIPVDEFIRQADRGFATPQVEWKPITAPERPTGHVALVSDFAQAILNDRDPLCSGREAVKSLELANAMLLSAHKRKMVTLPLDRQEYTEFLNKMIAKFERRASRKPRGTKSRTALPPQDR